MPIETRPVATDVAVMGDAADRSARYKARRVLLRPMIDAVATFAFLCLVGLTCATAPTSAGPTSAALNHPASISSTVVKAVGERDERPVVEIATTSSPASPDAAYRRTSVQTAWALLMMALSIVVALNLALLRHMRQAYKPPRRRNTHD